MIEGVRASQSSLWRQEEQVSELNPRLCSLSLVTTRLEFGVCVSGGIFLCCAEDWVRK